MTIPANLPVTPRELTTVLREAGTLERGTILQTAFDQLIQTAVSNLWFFTTRYSHDCTPELPTRLLLKWPVKNSPAPERGAPELIFYRQLAPALPSPPIVRCLATAPIESDHQWLILEDLRSSHANPPWPERPSDEALETAVSSLATLHRNWWESPALGSTVGTLHTESSLRAMVRGIGDSLPAFLSDLGVTLPTADHHLLEGVFSSSLRPWLRLVEPRALTVVHGDAHTWNFLFARSGTGAPYLIDWQLWHLDLGVRDLAFMIALHWNPTVRQALELPLLRLYHTHLVRHGIRGYSFDDLWLDYRRCVVRNLTFPIILWARGLPPEAWRHRLDCALAAYRELGADELL